MIVKNYIVAFFSRVDEIVALIWIDIYFSLFYRLLVAVWWVREFWMNSAPFFNSIWIYHIIVKPSPRFYKLHLWDLPQMIYSFQTPPATFFDSLRSFKWMWISIICISIFSPYRNSNYSTIERTETQSQRESVLKRQEKMMQK